jgi:hypothetical protein
MFASENGSTLFRHLTSSFTVLFDDENRELGANGFTETAERTVVLVLHPWGVKTFFVEILRFLQHFSGTELYAEVAPLAPLASFLYYMYLSPRNLDLTRV